jgi:hypothetical protein
MGHYRAEMEGITAFQRLKDLITQRSKEGAFLSLGDKVLIKAGGNIASITVLELKEILERIELLEDRLENLQRALKSILK